VSIQIDNKNDIPRGKTITDKGTNNPKFDDKKDATKNSFSMMFPRKCDTAVMKIYLYHHNMIA